jgi:hypothetical protein
MFGREKKRSAAPQPNAPVVAVGGRLRDLCGSDEEMYTALSRLLLLDPKKIVSSLETFLSEAQDYEMKGNLLRAEVGYRVAGSMSLWKGDAEGVRKYFTKASMFAGEARPEYRAVAKRSDEAVAIARKYYEVPATAQKP